MIRTIRCALVVLAGALGLAVATAAPAFAGLTMSNHTEPFARVSSTR